MFAPSPAGRSRFGFVVGACALLSGGCGGGEPYPMAPVSGAVRYADDTIIPAARICVEFVPQAEPRDSKTFPRTGAAEVDVASGAFHQATTHRYGDGVVAGRHRVLVTAYDAENFPTPAVDPRYRDPQRSPLEMDTADAPFEIKIPRPASP